jgi:hypothetical protein
VYFVYSLIYFFYSVIFWSWYIYFEHMFEIAWLGICLILIFSDLLFCFLYPDGIASIANIGFKSNELLQLKHILHMDLSDVKLNELLKSNNLDVSNKILSLLSLSMVLLFLLLPLDESFDFYMYTHLSYCH